MHDDNEQDFHKWLDDCPVKHKMTAIDGETITFCFELPDDDIDGDHGYDEYKEERAGLND